jgi:hypothetical protein
MTQLADLIDTAPPTLDQVIDKLTDHLMAGLGYNDVEKVAGLPALNDEL